jgi:hypothetical protein
VSPGLFGNSLRISNLNPRVNYLLLTEPPTLVFDAKDSTVEVKRLDGQGETTLYCQSTARAHKEESMKASFQKHFEEGLQAISDSLIKKQGHKGILHHCPILQFTFVLAAPTSMRRNHGHFT